MSPEKCSYIFYSGNPSKNNKLSLKLFGKQTPYTDSPVFLRIKFDQSLCFKSQRKESFEFLVGFLNYLVLSETRGTYS
ncbi:hypothetical protein BpHYR1_027467 [Brachionus plicatilis]|uniref:Uncharacterized protein n=1 Tax=Brachionus plicatilis TaxID=10195 RepID=A0A3M7P818_BRAPC|nr:hypothetical protein BpHYR1_027467 [Brachionus plicatilis]